jgi:hypothetical protein
LLSHTQKAQHKESLAVFTSVQREREGEVVVNWHAHARLLLSVVVPFSPSPKHKETEEVEPSSFSRQSLEYEEEKRLLFCFLKNSGEKNSCTAVVG